MATCALSLELYLRPKPISILHISNSLARNVNANQLGIYSVSYKERTCVWGCHSNSPTSLRPEFDVFAYAIWIKWEKMVQSNWVSFRQYHRLGLWFNENTCFLIWIQLQTTEGQLPLERKWIILYRKRGMSLCSMGLMMKELWLVISNLYFKSYLNAGWLLKMFKSLIIQANELWEVT